MISGDDLNTLASELERGLVLIARTMTPRNGNGEEALEALEGFQKVAFTAQTLRGEADEHRRERLRGQRSPRGQG